MKCEKQAWVCWGAWQQLWAAVRSFGSIYTSTCLLLLFTWLILILQLLWYINIVILDIILSTVVWYNYLVAWPKTWGVACSFAASLMSFSSTPFSLAMAHSNWLDSLSMIWIPAFWCHLVVKFWIFQFLSDLFQHPPADAEAVWNLWNLLVRHSGADSKESPYLFHKFGSPKFSIVKKESKYSHCFY